MRSWGWSLGASAPCPHQASPIPGRAAYCSRLPTANSPLTKLPRDSTRRDNQPYKVSLQWVAHHTSANSSTWYSRLCSGSANKRTAQPSSARSSAKQAVAFPADLSPSHWIDWRPRATCDLAWVARIPTEVADPSDLSLSRKRVYKLSGKPAPRCSTSGAASRQGWINHECATASPRPGSRSSTATSGSGSGWSARRPPRNVRRATDFSRSVFK